MRGKGIAWISFASALAMLAACITIEKKQAPPSLEKVRQPDVGPSGPLSGIWQGRSTSNGNEIRRITLRLAQSGIQVSGDYSCESQNAICRNLNDAGTLAGKVTNNYFAAMIIMLPDNSQCYFTGRVAESLIFGDYECLDRARLIEVGTWRVQRSG